MKKLLLILLLVLMPLISFATPPETTIKVGAFDLYPSIFIDEDGTTRGLVVDILAAIADKEGWNIRYVPGTWADNLKDVSTGKTDLITNIVYTTERDKFLDYNKQPIMTIWTEVFSNKKADIKNIFDLKNKKIGVMKRDFNADVFMKYAKDLKLNCTYEYFCSQKEILEGIEEGKVDAGVVNSITGSGLGDNYDIKKTNIILAPFPIYFAVSEGNSQYIIDTIDYYLIRWQADKTSIYHEKLNEWFYKELETNNKIPTHALIIMAVMLIVAIIAVGSTITLNKLVELRTKELQETKDKFKGLFDNSPLSYQALSVKGYILEINDTWADTLLYDRRTVKGTKFGDLMTKDSKEKYRKLLDYRSLDHISDFELDLIRSDGVVITVDFHAKVIRDNKGVCKIMHCAFRDITEQKILEEHVRYSQKMESIGTMAAGIAHDFNNFLFIILSTTQLVKMHLDPEKHEKDIQYLGNVLDAANRGTELIRQILSFSRQSVQELINMDIKPILKEVLQLNKIATPSSINIKSYIDKTQSYVIKADPTQIYQIMMNLMTNARQAVEADDGTIEVKLEKVHLINGELTNSYLTPGHYAKLTIKDDGYGIDPEIIDKIFDPYFTTKQNEEGTGLGLSVVYGIIKDYGGDIKVTSKPGEGATFIVYLPLIYDEAKPIIERNQKEPELQGSGTVMVVDDEQSIALIEQLYFLRYGYEVDTFTNSEEALDAFRTRPYKYDLVVTDMAMPGMAGDRLSKALLEIKPTLPIIICSGYSKKMNTEIAKAIGIKKFFSKPVDVTKLVEEAGRLLKT